jgi:hypothetical protein
MTDRREYKLKKISVNPQYPHSIEGMFIWQLTPKN